MKPRTAPWLPTMANYLLAARIAQGNIHTVFEYGSGSSTLWFYQHLPLQQGAHIVSVEHDADWYNQIKAHNLPSLTLINHPQPYHAVISNYPDNYFDIILVDGRNRNACMQAAIPKLKAGGWLLLDNSEREYYQKGIDLMHGWNYTICAQPQPDNFGFTYAGWQCTIFEKP